MQLQNVLGPKNEVFGFRDKYSTPKRPILNVLFFEFNTGTKSPINLRKNSKKVISDPKTQFLGLK